MRVPKSLFPDTLHGLLAILAVAFGLSVMPAGAAVGGSISGTVTDQSGAVVAGATLNLVNTSQQTTYQTVSNKQGLYSFPNLPVGHYDLTTTATGFSPQRKNGVAVDTDSAIRVDFALEIGVQTDTVTVTSDIGVQVETAATHLGEVVFASEMTALPRLQSRARYRGRFQKLLLHPSNISRYWLLV